jgi:hypothetical protein
MFTKLLRIILLVSIYLTIAPNLFAGEVYPAVEEIAKIEKRGKEIADYERSSVGITDLLLSRATDLALKNIEPEIIQSSTYNPIVIREKDGTITVYLLPVNQEPNVTLIGGDFRISISGDITKVLNKEKLHNAILKVPLELKPGQEPAGAFHTHVMNDLPTETDVALILLNPKLAPHYIAGPKLMSRIDADGKITIMGRTEEILKNKEFDPSK